jgi:23S rRNA (adenine2030-N6)-methyltransferase
MLSYRHGFHAGNHADVLKHAVYQFVLQYMNLKNKPFSIVDTHAGAGAYSLSSDFSDKNKEYETGISKLWNRTDLPAMLGEYVNSVKAFNLEEGHKQLSLYPGSPWFALQALPMEGKAFFHELHPSDFDLLRQFVRTNRYRKAVLGDGFVESIGLMPPPSKRGVTIIDPPYELKEDYQRVVDYCTEANRRFASGVILIWYPVVDRYRITQMEQVLNKSKIRNVQLFELNVAADSNEKGMTGSGMIVINPPWTLKQEMDLVLPYLVEHLSNNEGNYRSMQLIPE